jgi:phosphatidylinositol alpha-1,6-mannosyltransferase
MLKVTDAIVVYPCLETVAPVQKIEHEPRRLLTISRLVQRKGHERVFEALAELKRRGHADGIEYHIAGTGTYEVVLREQVSALHLQELVIFHGDVDETERTRLYASCDVFVMPVVKDPIDKEGFGLVYLEAAAHGLPSIATRIVGVDEAVIDGVTGVLVDDNDIQALATTIDHLLNDRNERERLGTAGRERAIREFLCSDQFAKLEAYL